MFPFCMLVQQRQKWREQFKQGIVPVLYTATVTQNELVKQLINYINNGIEPTHVDFHSYLQFRNTNTKRYSIIMEQLMEYAIFKQLGENYD